MDCISSKDHYKYIRAFEDALRRQTNASQALAVSSGTAALHLALMASGVKPGDEVLVPALTFVGTANAVSHVGAIPVFIDGSLNVNPYKLRTFLARETVPTGHGRVNKRTERPVTALIVVHLLGIPADMTQFEQIAEEFKLILIEDAAEALGSKGCGNRGLVSTFSFNVNKILTTNGGGALVTNDEFLLAKAYQLATTARTSDKWLVEHDVIAWNYRMPNICAAMGLSQFNYLSDTIRRKAKLAALYGTALHDCHGLQMLEAPDGSNHWLTAILCDYAVDRDALLDGLHAEGIKARAIFTPLHLLSMYKDRPRDSLQYAVNTASRMVCLPSGPGLAQ
jgi:perosamine synthetase